MATQNVYTWTKVATSLPWGPYASCNPDPSDPSGRTWHCGGHGHHHGPGPPPPPDLNDLNMGRSSIAHFGHGQFDGDIYAPALSKLLSNTTSGFWYSNLHEGDCDSPTATACRWKVLQTVDRSENADIFCLRHLTLKMPSFTKPGLEQTWGKHSKRDARSCSKNASCVNGQIEKAVLARNNPCFGHCTPAEVHNSTSDCWIDWCVAWPSIILWHYAAACNCLCVCACPCVCVQCSRSCLSVLHHSC